MAVKTVFSAHTTHTFSAQSTRGEAAYAVSLLWLGSVPQLKRTRKLECRTAAVTERTDVTALGRKDGCRESRFSYSLLLFATNPSLSVRWRSAIGVARARVFVCTRACTHALRGEE